MSKIQIYREEEYQIEDKVLLIGINKLKANSYIDLNVDDKKIRVAVEFIQDLIIKESIGFDLYNTLAVLIRKEAIEGQWKVLLIDYIHPIFYYGVVAELIVPLSFKNRNIGTFQASDDKVYNTGLNDIKYLTSYYNNKKDFYLSKLQNYLNCNKCFSQFECPCSNKNYNYNTNINIKLR